MTGSPFASARRAPARWWRRSLKLLAAVIVVVAILWALAIGALWGYSWFQLGGLELTADQDVAALGSIGAQAPEEATTVLVTMTEPRHPTDPVQPGLAGPVALVQWGGGREVPAVLSLPAELPVTVDGQGTVSLEEVHREGGEHLVARAVTDYAELRIDHVISYTVDALPGLVAALGDVETCSRSGCVPVTAAELRTVQERQDAEPLVLGMAETLRAVAGSVDVASVILSPLATKRAIDVIAGEIRTDVSLRGTVLLELAAQLSDVPAPEVEEIPLFHNPDTGALVPLEEPAMIRFQRLRDGAPLRGDEDDGTVEQMVTDAVDVAVLNGAGVDGLAGQVRTRLETAGFRVVGTGNASTFEYDSTIVAYGPEPATTEAAAVVLADQLDGAELEALAEQPAFEGEPVDVVVTVGEDLADGAG